MHTSHRSLAALERLRADIARKLDRSYGRDNITESLSLERQYQEVVTAISAQRSQAAAH